MALTTTSTVTFDSVRAEMKRLLTSDEQMNYRGITKSAMTGLKYDQLFGISTAEELIIAEIYGRRARTSDDPENLYLFSKGHGLTARFNLAYQQQSLEKESEQDKALRAAYASNLTTIQEMHDRYLNLQRPAAPEDKTYVDEYLNQVAVDTVSWWNEVQMLERRQQGYYCKQNGQYFYSDDNCPKTRTIQSKLCECEEYVTCRTGDLPVPPYSPPHCSYHSCQG